MTASKLSYHHENLEQQLLDAAAAIIASQGAAALSLRALGDVVGVSRSAPYHYFSDKDDLLHQLGERGFVMLKAATDLAGAGHADHVASARAALFAYVQFAQANAALFRLMFAGILPRRLPLPLGGAGASYDFSSSAAAAAFGAMQTAVAALPGSAGLDNAAVMLRTNAIWAAVHGVAILAIDENLKLVAPEAVLSQLIDRLVE